MAQPGDGKYIPQHEVKNIGPYGVDLTKLYAPFRLLDEVYGAGTQDALKAHEGPIEFFGRTGWTRTVGRPSFSPETVYRVAPQPKVETVMLYGSATSMWGRHQSNIDTHLVVLTLVNGKPTFFGPVEEL